MPYLPLPAPSAAPFDLSPAGLPRAAALCLHGYSGSPYEVRVVADALCGRGVRCIAPLLPGHGTEPAALNSISFEQWRSAAHEAFTSLCAEYNTPIFLVGSSMGGLLALDLAAREPARVAGLILLAPALSFHPHNAQLLSVLSTGLWRLMPLKPKDPPGGDVACPEAQAKNTGYRQLPLGGVMQLRLLQQHVHSVLGAVTAPLSIIFGEGDHTIDPRSGDEIARAVGSAYVEQHRFKDSFHIVGIDVDRAEVCRRAVSFVDRILAPPQTETP